MTGRCAVALRRGPCTLTAYLVQPLEGMEVCAIGQLQDFDHLLDALTAQLLMDSIQVCCTLRPEVQLCQRPRVSALALQVRTEGIQLHVCAGGSCRQHQWNRQLHSLADGRAVYTGMMHAEWRLLSCWLNMLRHLQHPTFSTASGSDFSTVLICFDHTTTAFSRMCMLTLSLAVWSGCCVSAAGRGSTVCPLASPMLTLTAATHQMQHRCDQQRTAVNHSRCAIGTC